VTRWVHSIHYRLGVLAKYPLGGGLEIGWRFEAPVAGKISMMPALEWDVRLGLRSRRLAGGSLHHNIAGGWLVGQLIDNSWYGEYAAGWGKGPVTFYANYRGLLQGSDYDYEVFTDDEGEVYLGLGTFRDSKRRWNNRAAAGLSLFLGDHFFLLPGHISPEVSLIFPHYCKTRDLAVNFSVGVQWTIK